MKASSVWLTFCISQDGPRTHRHHPHPDPPGADRQPDRQRQRAEAGLRPVAPKQAPSTRTVGICIPTGPASIGNRSGIGTRNGTAPAASASASRPARRRSATGPAPAPARGGFDGAISAMAVQAAGNGAGEHRRHPRPHHDRPGVDRQLAQAPAPARATAPRRSRPSERIATTSVLLATYGQSDDHLGRSPGNPPERHSGRRVIHYVRREGVLLQRVRIPPGNYRSGR